MDTPGLEFPVELGEQDALLWRMEREPIFRSTLPAITLLACAERGFAEVLALA